jgi:hypothetical protein
VTPTPASAALRLSCLLETSLLPISRPKGLSLLPRPSRNDVYKGSFFSPSSTFLFSSSFVYLLIFYQMNRNSFPASAGSGSCDGDNIKVKSLRSCKLKSHHGPWVLMPIFINLFVHRRHWRRSPSFSLLSIVISPVVSVCSIN